ncbi:putative GNAT family N-acyltransferase [Oikeobacillus pervagus]|uniref:GNAT family N-acyltransferase n=1 Tax=Oikeobacillus pervagus TaxID=1325931 RepID=A0AAJ1T2S9_9BACI|nr:GNAT family N-acetyltransferase [Oikeobacillus pervagus]MDQ0215636.1 putative GNAT family N-acyltransferase [Oikeobacillus pervagus]
MNIIIAKKQEELQQVFNVRKTVFVQEQNVSLEEEIDEFEHSAIHFLLKEEEQALGAGRFRILNGIGKVERICVLKELRGKGAGKKIMQAIEQYAKNQSIPLLKLNAQMHAIPFYENLGYRVVSEEFLDAGIPHKTMIKEIE